MLLAFSTQFDIPYLFTQLQIFRPLAVSFLTKCIVKNYECIWDDISHVFNQDKEQQKLKRFTSSRLSSEHLLQWVDRRFAIVENAAEVVRL